MKNQALTQEQTAQDLKETNEQLGIVENQKDLLNTLSLIQEYTFLGFFNEELPANKEQLEEMTYLLSLIRKAINEKKIGFWHVKE